MSKITIAEHTHVVNIIPPVDINGTGKSSDVFSLENYNRCSIILQMGVTGCPVTVTVQECDDFTPANSTAIAFSVYKEETALGDTLGSRTAVTSAGFSTSANDNIFYVIEIEAAELSDGYPCVRLVLSDPGVSTIVSAAAILSSPRYLPSETAIA
jgi:hypothetical protein